MTAKVATAREGLSWTAIGVIVSVLAIAAGVAAAGLGWHANLLIEINSALAGIRSDLKTALKALESADAEREQLRCRLDEHDRRITTLEAHAPRSPP